MLKTGVCCNPDSRLAVSGLAVVCSGAVWAAAITDEMPGVGLAATLTEGAAARPELTDKWGAAASAETDVSQTGEKTDASGRRDRTLSMNELD